jgi:hypothetical protein
MKVIPTPPRTLNMATPYNGIPRIASFPLSDKVTYREMTTASAYRHLSLQNSDGLTPPVHALVRQDVLTAKAPFIREEEEARSTS